MAFTEREALSSWLDEITKSIGDPEKTSGKIVGMDTCAISEKISLVQIRVERTFLDGREIKLNVGYLVQEMSKSYRITHLFGMQADRSLGCNQHD